MNTRELVDYIFELRAAPLSESCLHGFQTCPRFKAFAYEYRNKLRRKVRGAQDPDALAAIWSEFSLAWWLLQEQRFHVLYEPALKDKRKGPDFTARFKEQIVFHIEVTRVRSVCEQNAKLTGIVCGKLFQLPAGAINLLVIVTDQLLPKDMDVASLLQRADSKEEEYFLKQGFVSSRGFLRYYNRLSGVLLRTEDASADVSRLLWLNVRATHPLPSDLRRILETLPFVDRL